MTKSRRSRCERIHVDASPDRTPPENDRARPSASPIPVPDDVQQGPTHFGIQCLKRRERHLRPCVKQCPRHLHEHLLPVAPRPHHRLQARPIDGLVFRVVVVKNRRPFVAQPGQMDYRPKRLPLPIHDSLSLLQFSSHRLESGLPTACGLVVGFPAQTSANRYPAATTARLRASKSGPLPSPA